MTTNASLLGQTTFEMSFESRVKLNLLAGLCSEALIQTKDCKCRRLLSLELAFYSSFLMHYNPYAVTQ